MAILINLFMFLTFTTWQAHEHNETGFPKMLREKNPFLDGYWWLKMLLKYYIFACLQLGLFMMS